MIPRYRLTITYVDHPWWSLGKVERIRWTSYISPEGCTREMAEGWRARCLETPTVTGASLEVVE